VGCGATRSSCEETAEGSTRSRAAEPSPLQMLRAQSAKATLCDLHHSVFRGNRLNVLLARCLPANSLGRQSGHPMNNQVGIAIIAVIISLMFTVMFWTQVGIATIAAVVPPSAVSSNPNIQMLEPVY
jgi:hypothetical protein